MDERLTVFLAEIEYQWNEALRIYPSIDEKTRLLKKDVFNEDLINSLAYKLHNLYSAYEDMFKIVATFFENQIEDFSKYHMKLLKRMLIKIEGTRPNLLSEESFRILDELRGFRHVFRYSYTYELDAERIIKLAEKSMKLKEVFSKDFEVFTGKLKAEDKLRAEERKG